MKVSTVMTVYNAAWCVERALDSVMAQTRRPDEIIVCDDGSTDGTPELIEHRYGAAVTVLRLPHRNASATRAVGLGQATGDWLAFMDADDSWRPDKMERQLAFIAEHPEIRFVSSDATYVSADGVIRESWLADYFDPVVERVGDLLAPLVERCFVLMSSVMVERDAYHESGGLDPEIVYSHDYDLWMRILARHPGGLMADRLIEYFWSPGALSRRFEARYRDDLALMRRVEEGSFGRRPDLMRKAHARAASLEFDLGLMCLRSGRADEGRIRMRRALIHGPFRRRMFAVAGSMLPDWALTPLMRSAWVKETVAGARDPATHIAMEPRSSG
jgi:glycosyltransferase involved in cell wall biosynthesis